MEQQILRFQVITEGARKGITIYDFAEVSLKKGFNEQKGIYKHCRLKQEKYL